MQTSHSEHGSPMGPYPGIYTSLQLHPKMPDCLAWAYVTPVHKGL